MVRSLDNWYWGEIGTNNIVFTPGEPHYVQMYSFGGGALTLIDIAVAAKGSNLSELQWSIGLSPFDLFSGNAVSGTIPGSSVVAGQWLRLTIPNVTLPPSTSFVLGLIPIGDTFTIQNYTHGWSMPWFVHHSKYFLYGIYTFSGSYLGLLAYRYLSVIYRIGNVWYGNPFTSTQDFSLMWDSKTGNSYLLDKPVSVVGARIGKFPVSGSIDYYGVYLYECGPDFLPVGSPVRSLDLPRTNQVVWWEPYQASRFSIMVGSVESLDAVFDSYSLDASRLNAVCPEIRGVENLGNGWQLSNISGKQVVYANISPIIEYDGYVSSAAGGAPVPSHVIIT